MLRLILSWPTTARVSLHQPDDYYAKLPARYRGFTPATFDAAARSAIDPAKLTWVVVGDARLVRPQLDGLGLPIETLQAGVSGQ